LHQEANMGIADKLDQLAVNRKNTEVCAYQTLYDSLPKADQIALDEAWAKNYSINIILTAIRSEGHKTSNETLRSHKNKVCKCHQK